MPNLPDNSQTPKYQTTMAKLEELKRVTPTGNDYWLAREIHGVLGYPIWESFESVMQRATDACAGIGLKAENHFRRTTKMVSLGSGAKRKIVDFFLSRGACYLVAMNGDPAKTEIAAAQAYFAIQTRRMEQRDSLTDDERRLELRQRVSGSFKKVSSVARDAGVKNAQQAAFHDARYQGLYDMPLQAVKRRKKLGDKELLFDRAGALELSANDFQMNLAADVIKRENIRNEQEAIGKNREVGSRVRKVMRDANVPMPEDLPLEPPIKEIAKRVKAKQPKLLKD